MEPRRLAVGGVNRSLAQQGGEPVGLGPVAAGQASGQGVEVNQGRVYQRVGLDAFSDGTGQVLLGAPPWSCMPAK
jgi:hypothetical protein